MVLFLVGVMLFLGLIAHKLSKSVRENITLSVILDDSLPYPEAMALQKKLEAAVWAKSVQYYDKEAALRALKENIGENPEDFLGTNPLLASFDVFLNADYANNDTIQSIENQLRKFNGVEDVIYRKDLVHLVNDNIERIGLVLLILAVLLTLMSLSLIRNTVRLKLYSMRFQIRTMQLVGASNRFIRKPFLIENLWSGALSAVIAFALLFGLMYYFEQRLNGMFQILDIGTLLVVFLTLLLFGVFIILSATWFGVTRYLKMNVSDLYLV
jgi:cell division transport system permease protein